MLRYIHALLLLLLCMPVRGQEYVVDIKHWDMRDGLPHRHVENICIDRQGQMWLATKFGISRFDGYKFVNYSDRKFRNVRDIYLDSAGYLILSNYAEPKPFIYRVDPLTMQTHGLDDTLAAIKSFLPPNTSRHSLSTLVNKGTLIVSNDTLNRMYVWPNGRKPRGVQLPLSYHIALPIFDTSYILAQDDSGYLKKIDYSGNVVKKVKAPFPKGSRAWYPDTRFTYVFIPERPGVVFRVSDDLEITDVTDDLKISSISKVRPGRLFDVGNEGVVWVAGKLIVPGKGVIYDVQKQQSEEFRREFGAVLTDGQGRIWLPSEFGLFCVHVEKNKFRQYFNDTAATGYANTCRAIIKKDGHIYVCNEFSGCYRINLATYVSQHIFKEPFNSTLVNTPAGILTGRYNLWDGQTKQLRRLFKQPAAWNWCAYRASADSTLFFAPDSMHWVDTRKLTITAFAGYGPFAELSNAIKLHAAPGEDRKLYICANTGLYEFERGRGVTARYSAADTGRYYLPSMEFQHFSKDAQGIYWLATSNGLIRWEPLKGRHRLYDSRDGFSNDNIYAVYNDSFGNVWMSSDYGVMRMNKATGAIRTYTTDDGITNNEFNRVSHYQDDSGNIYFGSLRGITVFNPRDFEVEPTDKAKSGPLIVTSFVQFSGETDKLLDRRAELIRTNRIVVQPGDKFFTIEFSLLNYSNPQQTQYYWKIDGIDTGWNQQGDRVLRLSRLPYGSYTLRVKAKSVDGYWSRNELAIALNVKRPFYLQAWFFAALAALIVASIMGFYRWRVARLRRENERLDRVVQEKTRDLQRKTEDLETSLAQKEVLLREVHHRVKNNLQMIISLLNMKSRSVTEENARNALLESRSRVMSMSIIHQKLYQHDDLGAADLRSFVNEMFDHITGITPAGMSKTALNNEIPETRLPLDRIIPIGLIVNELMTNSFKYAFSLANGLTIKVELSVDDGMYVLTYRDSGPGLPAGIGFENAGTMGMRLISRLCSQLKGKAAYSNEGGCTFIIQFPV